jgi:hypothetical protein
MVSRPGFVDTVFGPMPGCPECGIIKLGGEPHLCIHGVTAAPEIEVSLSLDLDVDQYGSLMGWLYGR